MERPVQTILAMQGLPSCGGHKRGLAKRKESIVLETFVSVNKSPPPPPHAPPDQSQGHCVNIASGEASHVTTTQLASSPYKNGLAQHLLLDCLNLLM